MLEEYNEILTIQDLMEILGVGKNAAYELLKSGEIRAFRLKGRWKISKIALIDYIKSKSV